MERAFREIAQLRIVLKPFWLMTTLRQNFTRINPQRGYRICVIFCPPRDAALVHFPSILPLIFSSFIHLAPPFVFTSLSTLFLFFFYYCAVQNNKKKHKNQSFFCFLILRLTKSTRKQTEFRIDAQNQSSERVPIISFPCPSLFYAYW